ncbi:hypothetical protein ASPCADRAFT_11303 [Aspergillus carbonarius ITEM 5010]|uniref:Uncharacterized protein n=1 Tax=Aspergillus carbonarius (strain ITEM 5010) TaxID=602072 RepID=A0A1R3R5Q0_ASPC5|nr:hypothetical protein ASPCADRAFT_11303 [Aspergillus carbonarius ITEM 5010]
MRRHQLINVLVELIDDVRVIRPFRRACGFTGLEKNQGQFDPEDLETMMTSMYKSWEKARFALLPLGIGENGETMMVAF